MIEKNCEKNYISTFSAAISGRKKNKLVAEDARRKFF